MNIKIFQKQLKTNQTNAEQTFWYYLRNRHLGNYKFRRQVIIDSYIVDFVCFEKKLIVECDGGQYNNMEKKALDEVRTQNLVSKGYRILRFWNHDILEKTEDVLNNIYKELQK
ncbi:endonuclease domain-containing protein [Cysteiniphilum halobium]|uniref:endonuclease domain-containing protein n=1 Tax=Cysteiniphilum halobium TaxID=2219059 RepID=UPI000E6577DB|nr:endonuclease domain-containing protein [Cysteiniphilum halobium]